MTLAFWTTWFCAASLCLWVGLAEDNDAVIYWHVRTVVPLCLAVYALIVARMDWGAYYQGEREARRQAEEFRRKITEKEKPGIIDSRACR